MQARVRWWPRRFRLRTRAEKLRKASKRNAPAFAPRRHTNTGHIVSSPRDHQTGQENNSRLEQAAPVQEAKGRPSAPFCLRASRITKGEGPACQGGPSLSNAVGLFRLTLVQRRLGRGPTLWRIQFPDAGDRGERQ